MSEVTYYVKPTVLEQFIIASEAPLADSESNNSCQPDQTSNINMMLEDPDLMPKIDDWLLVQSRNRIFFSYDGDEFITGFFTQPAAWRLINCAAKAYGKKLPEFNQLSYFRRARRAVIRGMQESPCHKLVQTLYFISLFAAWKGQPEAGRPFLKMALELILKLRLNIDPDDSPWLGKLTSRQKEDRRRAFWGCFLHMRFHYAVSSDAIYLDIDANCIKPPGAVNCPFPIFHAMPEVEWMSEIYYFIGSIRRIHSRPPKSIDDLLASSKLNNLQYCFIQLQTHVPLEYILLAESPATITEQDFIRFLNQLNAFVEGRRLFVLSLNIELLSAMSLFNRPQLYLTGLSSYSPIYISQSSREILTACIQQCLDVAFRIAHFVPLMVNFGTYTYAVVLPFFESMNVFWFVWCRMKRIWWTLVPAVRPEWANLHNVCSNIVEYVRDVYEREGSKGGTTSPILQCMEAMLREMVDVAGGILERSDRCEDILVFEMKIASLDEDDDQDVVEQKAKEPPCYLGLLGMEIDGRLRWSGPSEESWRLFWKLY
ncbi:hypothetical protein BDR26DRAFT_861861 [Obelidium mucronatum]|nr:hypothetical protein BDR26DRAFT_861861 [Obelidium mucronatum]